MKTIVEMMLDRYECRHIINHPDNPHDVFMREVNGVTNFELLEAISNAVDDIMQEIMLTLKVEQANGN